MLGTSWDDPRTMATLAAAQALLGRGGSMQRLAAGAGNYAGVLDAVKSKAADEEDRKLRRVLQQQQLQQTIDAQRAQAQAQQTRGAFLDAVDPSVGPAMPVSLPAALKAGLSLQEAGALLPTDTTEDAVALAPGAVLVGRTSGREIARNAASERDDEFTRLLRNAGIDPQSPAGRSMYLKMVEQKVNPKPLATATATATTAGNSIIREVAGGLGKQIDSTHAEARASIPAIQTAQNIKTAVDTGKIISGPGASFRVFGLQIGQMLGVGGKDGAEVLANTRTAIQSMAQAELAAAQQMRGQGQITEAEREIIRRAAAGRIDELTAPEMRLLADSMEKTARFKLRQHKKNVESLGKMEGAAPLLPFYMLDEPPPYQAPGGSSQFRVLGVEGK